MIRYEIMQQTHVQQIAALEKECFSDPWSVASIASELSNPLSLWLVALDGDRVVGYVGSQSVLDGADVMNLAVSSQYRRQGIAQNLMLLLEKELKKKGVLMLALEVRVSNTAAISLYEMIGFRQVGRRPRYYSNPREDALILRKEWQL